jgi:hypothetical protein
VTCAAGRSRQRVKVGATPRRAGHPAGLRLWRCSRPRRGARRHKGVRAAMGLAREMEHPGGEAVDSALRGDCLAIGIRTSVPAPKRKMSSDQGVRPCRLNRPSPKVWRERALWRAKTAFVPPAQYQGPCEKARKTCASRRRSPSGRRVGYVVTGAGKGTGAQPSLNGNTYRTGYRGLEPVLGCFRYASC